MQAQKAYKIIDTLRFKKPNGNYYLDFVPFTFPNEDYSELADYLDKTYKPDFAKKITFIAFAIIYNYDSHIFLDPELASSYPDLASRDLRHEDLGTLASLIEKMIIDNYSAINIMFKHHGEYSLMRVADEYDTSFFNLTGQKFKMIKSLVDRQGLYLK